MEHSTLTEQQKTELEEAFKGRLETGCEGLTQQQAREALCLLGLNPTGLDISKFWVDELNKQESDCIDIDDFMKLRCFVDEDPETVLRWAFNKFDTNNDGTIDATELKKILRTIYNDAEGAFVDEEFVNHVLTLADDNGDGVLQIEEFVDMLLARTGTPQSKTST